MLKCISVTQIYFGCFLLLLYFRRREVRHISFDINTLNFMVASKVTFTQLYKKGMLIIQKVVFIWCILYWGHGSFRQINMYNSKHSSTYFLSIEFKQINFNFNLTLFMSVLQQTKLLTNAFIIWNHSTFIYYFNMAIWNINFYRH